MNCGKLFDLFVSTTCACGCHRRCVWLSDLSIYTILNIVATITILAACSGVETCLRNSIGVFVLFCFLCLLLQGWFLDHCILALLANVHLRPSAPCGAQTAPAMPFTSRWTWSPQTRSGYLQLWRCHPKRWIFQPSCMPNLCIDPLSLGTYSRCILKQWLQPMSGWSMVVKSSCMMHHQKQGFASCRIFVVWGMGMTWWPTGSPGGDQDGFSWGQLEIGENLMLSEAGCHQPRGAPWACMVYSVHSWHPDDECLT